jgi:hypothetical protein
MCRKLIFLYKLDRMSVYIVNFADIYGKDNQMIEVLD